MIGGTEKEGQKGRREPQRVRALVGCKEQGSFKVSGCGGGACRREGGPPKDCEGVGFSWDPSMSHSNPGLREQGTSGDTAFSISF